MILKNFTLLFLFILGSSIFGSGYELIKSEPELRNLLGNKRLFFIKVHDAHSITLSIPYTEQIGHYRIGKSIDYFCVFEVNDKFVVSHDEKTNHDLALFKLNDPHIPGVFIGDMNLLYSIIFTLSNIIPGLSSFVSQDTKLNDAITQFLLSGHSPTANRITFRGLLVFDQDFNTYKQLKKPSALRPLPTYDPSDGISSTIDVASVEDLAEYELEVGEGVGDLKLKLEQEFGQIKGTMIKLIDTKLYNEIVDQLKFTKVKKFDSDITAAYVIMTNKNYDLQRLYANVLAQLDDAPVAQHGNLKPENPEDGEQQQVVRRENTQQLHVNRDITKQELEYMFWDAVASNMSEEFGVNLEYIPLKDNNPDLNILNRENRKVNITKGNLVDFEEEANSDYDLRIAGYASNRTITVLVNDEIAKRHPEIKFGSLTYHKLVGGWFKFHGIFILRSSHEPFDTGFSENGPDKAKFLESPPDLDLEKLMVSAFSNDFRAFWRDINDTVDPSYKYSLKKFVADVIDVVVEADVTPIVSNYLYNIAIALINSVSINCNVNKYSLAEENILNSIKLFNQYRLMDEPVEPKQLEENIKDKSHDAAISTLFMAYINLYNQYAYNSPDKVAEYVPKVDIAKSPQTFNVSVQTDEIQMPEPVQPQVQAQPQAQPQVQPQVQESEPKSDVQTHSLKTESSEKSTGKSNVVEIVLYIVCSVLIAGIVIYASSKCLCKQKVKFLDFYKEDAVAEQ